MPRVLHHSFHKFLSGQIFELKNGGSSKPQADLNRYLSGGPDKYLGKGILWYRDGTADHCPGRGSEVCSVLATSKSKSVSRAVGDPAFCRQTEVPNEAESSCADITMERSQAVEACVVFVKLAAQENLPFRAS